MTLSGPSHLPLRDAGKLIGISGEAHGRAKSYSPCEMIYGR